MSILIPFYALNVIAAQCGAILLAKGAGWNDLLALAHPGRRARRGGPARALVRGDRRHVGHRRALLLYSLLDPSRPTQHRISSLWLQLRAILAPVTAGALAGLACIFIHRVCAGRYPAHRARLAGRRCHLRDRPGDPARTSPQGGLPGRDASDRALRLPSASTLGPLSIAPRGLMRASIVEAEAL